MNDRRDRSRHTQRAAAESAIARFLSWFDTRRLAVAILFVGLFAMAARVPTDTDTWWHLQAGRVMLETGRILQTDVFSHTRAGSAWVNHSWLSQIWLAWLFGHFRYAGLGLWLAATVALTFGFVYRQMEGSVFLRAFVCILAAATSALVWIARPQLFSLLLTAVVAHILYLLKWRQVNRLWLLPPLFVLWVNLHAGYALGFMVLSAFIGGEIANHVLNRLLGPGPDPVVGWRQLGLLVGISLLSALLLVINPNTTRMWTYYLDTVNIGALQDYIQEWRSPDFHVLAAQPMIWLLLGTLAALGLSGRRVDGSDLALVGLFAYATLMAGRNVGPFALVAAPVLSRHAAAVVARWRGARPPLRPRPRPNLGMVNLALLALVLLAAVIKIRVPLQASLNEQLQRQTLPVDAVAWIRQHRPAGEMFNPYNWGGYLIWALWPEYRVFVDGRTDLYGDSLLRQYLDAQGGRPGTDDVLATYGVDWVLTYPDDGLSLHLRCTPGWREVYRDPIAVIWQRSGAGTSAAPAYQGNP